MKLTNKLSGYFSQSSSSTSKQGLTLQGLLFCILFYAVYAVLRNTQANLENLGIESGFGFLSREAGLPIGDTLLEYSPLYSYAYAFLIGVLNTLFVCALAIIFATILGVTIGVARISTNWLVAKLAAIYVETIRNIPLLLTLLFIYFVFLNSLPSPKASFSPINGFFLTKRGFFMPKPLLEEGIGIVFFAAIISIVLALLFNAWAKAYHTRTGQPLPRATLTIVIVIIPVAIAYFGAGSPISWELSELKGFNFKGGVALKPEFLSLFFGLVLYTAAYIGENVRSGLESVAKGQLEAANALGIPAGVTTRSILLPQALRVTIPATTNDYASLVKNSSLAIAIGYPEMVSIGGTIIGQNGQAIEIIAMWMAVYLTINLIISVLMNWLNSSVQIVER